MKRICYSSEQIVGMTESQVFHLCLLRPKAVYFQMETSGSPSVWTENGESFVGHEGADIVRCAIEIRKMHAECEAYNREHGYGDNRKAYNAHICVTF